MFVDLEILDKSFTSFSIKNRYIVISFENAQTPRAQDATADEISKYCKTYAEHGGDAATLKKALGPKPQRIDLTEEDEQAILKYVEENRRGISQRMDPFLKFSSLIGVASVGFSMGVLIAQVLGITLL